MIFQRHKKLKMSLKPLFDNLPDPPKGRVPSTKWFCPKLNMASIDIKKLARLNNNCPGCATEAHEVGECQANPFRKAG